MTGPTAFRLLGAALLLLSGIVHAAKPDKPVIEGKARVVDGDTLWIGELTAVRRNAVCWTPQHRGPPAGTVRAARSALAFSSRPIAHPLT